MGVGGIQKKRLEDKKFVAKADELAENQVDGSSNTKIFVTCVGIIMSYSLYFPLLCLDFLVLEMSGLFWRW